MRGVVRVLAPLAAAALVLVPGAGVAAAADGETVASFDARIDVDARGDLHVTETVEYVFAGTTHHGLQRDVRTRSHPVSQVSASSPSGAPAQVSVTAQPTLTTIRVGDPQRTVSGRQTYVLRYTVSGAVDHDELDWNVTGDGWDVPIERASARVTGPRPAVTARCHGSTRPCTGTAGTTAVFAAQDLGPGQGLTAVVTYPFGTVTLPVAQAPEPSALGQIVGFVLLMGLVTGLVILAQWLVKAADAGPDRRPTGPRDVPDTTRSLVAVDLAGLPRPPAGLRPGHVAVLHEGRVETTAITATLADLTVRGHLRIEETSPSSWRLVAQESPAGEALLPYEQTLLAALFTGRESVTGAELRGSRHLAEVRRQLLDDATDRGWFPRERPRLDARVLGRGLAAGGVAVALVAHFSGTIPGFFVGIVVAAAGQVMATRGDRPVRPTPLGEAARLRVDRFRGELAAAAVERRSLDDGDDVFSTLLPFAIALGLADDWTDRFRTDARGSRWYGEGSLDLGAAVSVFGATVESASAFDTRARAHSSGSSWWGHSSGSSFGSSSGSSSSGYDSSSSSGSSGSSDHGGGGGGSSW